MCELGLGLSLNRRGASQRKAHTRNVVRMWTMVRMYMLDSSLPHRAKTTESLDKRRERERASLFSVKLLCEISWTYFYTLPFPLIPSHMTAANNRYTTRRRTSKEEAFDMAEEAGMKERRKRRILRTEKINP